MSSLNILPKQTDNKKRESNIELLRIVCMVLIITHHCVLHGGAINMDFCVNKWFSIFLLPGGKICFDTFLAISMWFLVDQSFKAERFAKIWIETLVYSLLFAYIAFLFGVQFSKKDIISVFFPITGNVHGFAAAYLILYALIPFLGIIVEKINKQQLQFLLCVLALSNIVTPVMGNLTGHFQKIFCNVGFWIFCYFLSLYLKKYSPKIVNKKIYLILLFIMCWMFIVILYVLKYLYPGTFIINYFITISTSHTSIPCIIGGYSLFFIFKGIKLPYIPLVNIFAKTTFGILMIHDHNFFRAPLWNQIIKTSEWYYSRFFVFRVGAVVAFIFFAAAVIDLLRIYLLEKNLFRINKLQEIFKKMDEVLRTSCTTAKEGGGVNVFYFYSRE